jgi:hypothetical protein
MCLWVLNDIAFLVRGKLLNSSTDLFQVALGVVQHWCPRTKLCIYPQKIVVVLFTRKRDLRGLKLPSISELRLTLYMAQLKNVINEAYRTF